MVNFEQTIICWGTNSLYSSVIWWITFTFIYSWNHTIHHKFDMSHTAWKVSKYGVISGPYSVRIRKIWTRNNSVFGNFSRSDSLPKFIILKQKCPAILRRVPSELFFKKGVRQICSRFTGEHLCSSAFSMKLLCSFIKIMLLHRRSAVYLRHILTRPNENIYWRLLPNNLHLLITS